MYYDMFVGVFPHILTPDTNSTFNNLILMNKRSHIVSIQSFRAGPFSHTLDNSQSPECHLNF